MAELGTSKAILILKSSDISISSTEVFLRNRGWDIHSTIDIKDALTYAIEKKPAYVLISVDYPNPKIAMLPKILKQASDITVMAFAENSSTYSENVLIGFEGADYRLFPPLTGPAVERCINKRLRDELKKNSGSYGDDAQASNLIADWVPLQDTGHFNDDENAELDRKFQTLVAMCAEESFFEVYKSDTEVPSPEIMKIMNVNNVTCVILDCARCSGYLVVAQEDGKYPEKITSSLFQNKFLETLRTKGVSIPDIQSIDVELKKNGFEQIAESSAKFIEKSVHLGNEMAIAFFPRKLVTIKVEESEIENMVKVKIDDLIGDHTVNFDIFIYLFTSQ